MIRDYLKEIDYFEAFIKQNEALYYKRLVKFQNGLIMPERETIVKLDMINNLTRRIKAKYSLGLPVISMLEEYNEALVLINNYWVGSNKFIGNNNEVLDQYSLDDYDTMLWMLSIGYLLDVSMDQFNIIVNAIDGDSIKDKLYEFIISAKIPSRPKIENESYKYGWVLYGKLREVIGIKDKSRATELVKHFLEEDWYREHRQSGWYNSHTNKHNTYSGYWSFETAAVVKIMELDDSSFIDNQYYPKDLVHQTALTSKK